MQQHVISIQISDIVTRGLMEGSATGFGWSLIVLMEHPDTPILRSQPIGYRQSLISRTVIHNHDLNIAVGLRQSALHTA